ncbi:response regulator [Uliginosibacterium sediminicola]|uniref:Response regulator n=1 Tax=Uliginosibacterium sediminicola TaxID=2024550 RepID=A0ABU9YV95_9RHOO
MGLFDLFFRRKSPTLPAPSVTQTERRRNPRRDAPKGTRVLIIDDSPTITAALGKILRSAGYVTLGAADAEHGLDILRKNMPAIVFLDIVLPGMNGFSALRMIRRNPLTRDIPVIMMSGNEQATEQFFGTRIGADDFLKKPFSRFEVFSRIERLLDDSLIPRRIVPKVPEPEETTPEQPNAR